MNAVHQITEGTGLFVVGAVFVIVLVVSLRALSEMGFTGASRKTLAFCVAALSVMGLTLLGPREPFQGLPQSGPSTFYFLLIPYAALGLALLALLLLVFISRCIQALKEKRRLAVKDSWPSHEYPAVVKEKPVSQNRRHVEQRGRQHGARQR